MLKIIPATDLSEQISTAGKEASGTGYEVCFKWCFNHWHFGWSQCRNLCDNIFIFGKQLANTKPQTKGYDPYIYYNGDEELKSVIDWLSSISPDEGNVLSDLQGVFLVG